MGSLKLPHASGNSMSIAAPATNPASDLELKLPATIGTAGQVLRNSSTAGTLEFGGLGGGITHADMWRLNSSFDDDSDPISNNWERVDNNGEGVIGAVSAPSSGIWTLPATGIWHIHFHIQGAALSENNAWPSAYIYTTVDNGSNWLKPGVGHHSSIQGGGSTPWQYFQVDSYVFLDVTNTSNVKFKLTTVNDGSSSNIRTTGNTEENQTFVQMVRLGDT